MRFTSGLDQQKNPFFPCDFWGYLFTLLLTWCKFEWTTKPNFKQAHPVWLNMPLMTNGQTLLWSQISTQRGYLFSVGLLLLGGRRNQRGGYAERRLSWKIRPMHTQSMLCDPFCMHRSEVRDGTQTQTKRRHTNTDYLPAWVTLPINSLCSLETTKQRAIQLSDGLRLRLVPKVLRFLHLMCLSLPA